MIRQYFKWSGGSRSMLIVHFLDESGEVVKGISIDTHDWSGWYKAITIIGGPFQASTQFQPITQSEFAKLLPDEMLELGIFAAGFITELKGGQP